MEIITALASFAIALFTWRLTVVSGRQVALMQAQFVQWVDLTNWRCAEQPRNNKLQILVDLVNPSGFPMTLSGNITIDEDEQPFDKIFLSPKSSPKTIEFHIGVAGDTWSVNFHVTARLIHPHMITREPITQKLLGKLECSTWQSDAKWHATFTALVDLNPNKSVGKKQGR